MDDEQTPIEFQLTAQDKAELMERIHASWAALVQTIGRLSDAQVTAPGPDGGWSVKDHLAHVTAWEQKLLAMVGGRPAHEGLQLDEATYLATDLDGMNAIIYERARELSLPEVLAAFRRSHEQVVAALEGLTEADLARPYTPGDPTDTRRLVDGIVGNTYEHYLEHQGWIEALIERA